MNNDNNDFFLCVCVQAFKPLVGKSLLSSVTAVEFLLDRQLDFLSDHSAYQPYQVIITLTHTNMLKKLRPGEGATTDLTIPHKDAI